MYLLHFLLIEKYFLYETITKKIVYYIAFTIAAVLEFYFGKTELLIQFLV